MPAPRRHIKQPPPSNQGVAQGVKTPEPKGDDRPPPIPPKPSHAAPQTQQATLTSPTVQRPVSPRVPVISSYQAQTSVPTVTSSLVTLPPVVTTQRGGLQTAGTGKFLYQVVMYIASAVGLV